MERKAFIGVVSRGAFIIEGIVKGEAEWDGSDATDRVADAVASSPHREQIRCILLDGLYMAGGNKVDAWTLYRLVNMPVILAFKDEFFNFYSDRNPWEYTFAVGSLKFYAVGLEERAAKNIIKASLGSHRLPEALIVARKIATAYNNLLRRTLTRKGSAS